MLTELYIWIPDIKLCQCLIRVTPFRRKGKGEGVELQLSVSLSVALHGGEWTASRPGRNGAALRWVDPGTGLPRSLA